MILSFFSPHFSSHTSLRPPCNHSTCWDGKIQSKIPLHAPIGISSILPLLPEKFHFFASPSPPSTTYFVDALTLSPIPNSTCVLSLFRPRNMGTCPLTWCSTRVRMDKNSESWKKTQSMQSFFSLPGSVHLSLHRDPSP